MPDSLRRPPTAIPTGILLPLVSLTLLIPTGSMQGQSAPTEPAPPPRIAALTSDVSALDEGGGVRLEASVEAADPSALDFEWDFGDGSPLVSGLGLTAVQHRFRNGVQGGSTYTVNLTVSGPGGGSDQASIRLSVANVAPRIVALQRDGAGLMGAPMSFLGQAVDPGADDAVTYQWDFGDGASGSGTQVQHSYRAPGRYTVTLDVDDGDGGTDQRTVGVTIGEGGELSVSGGVDIPSQDLTSSLLSATPIGDGMCQLRLQLNVEGDAGIGFQVILPRGLGPGTYRVGPTSQDAGMWDDEFASPGTFTATAAVDRAYDPPERRLFGFWSAEGTLSVEQFDGERLEASFAVELQERTVRSATPPPYWIDVTGWVAQGVGRDVLSGIPGSGPGGFYLCDVGPSPMEVVSFEPSDWAINVDLEEPEIRLRFGVPIDETTLHDGTFRLEYRLPDQGVSGERFAAVPGAWSPEGDGSYRFTPSGPLMDGVQYRARVRDGADGVRGARGEQLNGITTWHFTTLVEPTVRTAVYQVARNAPLVPGKPTAVRVYAEWREKPDVHPSWQAQAFPARVEVRVDGTSIGAYPAQDVPLRRPDRLTLEDSAQAKLSVNFFGWTPGTTGGTSTITATVEPAMQQRPEPRRFTSAPLEISHQPGMPLLEYEAQRVLVSSWEDGLPPELDQLTRDVVRIGAEFAAQNFPMAGFQGLVGDLPVAEPFMIAWTQANGIRTYRDLFSTVEQHEYLAKQAHDRVAPYSDADLLALLMPDEFSSGKAGQRYRFPGLETITIFVAPTVSPQSLDKNAGTFAHEFGHVLGLPHRSTCPDSFQDCLDGGKSGSDPVEGFRLALDGSTGWNKSKLEGNAEAPTTKAVVSLMHPAGPGVPALFIQNDQYAALLRDVAAGAGPFSPSGGDDAPQQLEPLPEPADSWSSGPSQDDPAVLLVRPRSLQSPPGFLVSGLTIPAEGRVAIDPVLTLDEPWTRPIPDGPYSLDVIDAEGTVRHSVSFGTAPVEAFDDVDAEWRPTQSGPAWFWVGAPFVPDAREFVIRREDTVLLRLPYTPNPPSVSDPEVHPEPDGRLRVTWTGSDTDGDAVGYMLRYSSDGASSWRSLSPWMELTEWIVDPASLGPGPAPTFQIVASDGFRQGKASVEVPR